MLKWIRGTRVNLKTGLFVVALTLLIWALVVYVNIRDFVPEEYLTPVDSAATR